MLTDLDETGLWQYRSSYKAPADFDEFWRRTLDEAAEVPLDVRITQVETGLSTIDVYDVTFAGYGGHPVRAWLRLPRLAAGGGEGAGRRLLLGEHPESRTAAREHEHEYGREDDHQRVLAARTGRFGSGCHKKFLVLTE